MQLGEVLDRTDCEVAISLIAGMPPVLIVNEAGTVLKVRGTIVSTIRVSEYLPLQHC